MKTNPESSQTLNDLIFENRNKAFGAYQLRNTYNTRLATSLLYTMMLIVLLFLIPLMISRFTNSSVPIPVMRSADDIVFRQFSFNDIEKLSIPKTENHFVKPLKQAATEPNSYNLVKKIEEPEKAITTPAQGTTDPGKTGPEQVIPGTGDNLASGGTRANPMEVIPILSIASVDVQPDFPGGIEKFYRFIQQHLKFTSLAREAGLNGRYYVSFVVDENGLVSNVEMMRPIGFGQDPEVISVLNQSPVWKPGMYHSKPVKTKMILPVNFSIIQ